MQLVRWLLVLCPAQQAKQGEALCVLGWETSEERGSVGGALPIK